MGYRFVKIASYYDAFLAQYYARYPLQPDLHYQEQYGHLMSQGFAWADHMARAMETFGVVATEIVENALPLQQSWAREHGMQDLTPLELLVEQIRLFGADVVFLQDPTRFSREWIRHLRIELPSLRLVAGWLCAPFDDPAIGVLHELDFVMTCTPGFLEEFQAQGLRAFHAYHAFAPRMLGGLDDLPATEPSDLVFVGSLFAGQGFHDERARVLGHLIAQNVNVQIYGNLAEPPLLKNKIKAGLISILQSVPFQNHTNLIAARIMRWRDSVSTVRFSRTLKRRVHPPVFGREMLRVLKDAKVAFNSHIGVAGRYAGNVRLFEATGAGACLLTDWKENLNEIFSEDLEVVTYRSAEECVEKARWLLDNPMQMKRIAVAGQARTLRDHNFERLAGQMDSNIRACMP